MTQELTVNWEPIKFDKYRINDDGTSEQVVWDVSSLDNILRCPTYYKYRNLLGLSPAIEPTATFFGSAVHHGFEVLDTCKFEGKTQAEALDAALVAVLEEYGEGLRHASDNARGLEPALRAITWRAEEHWEDPFEVLAMPDGKPALEVRFEVPIDFIDFDYRLSGRIDKIVAYNDDIYIADIKTTKKILNSYFFDGYSPSTQITGYMWVVRHVLGIPVRGFIIDGVQTAVENTRFGRASFDVSDDEVAEWQVMVGDAFRRLHEYRDTNMYPHNYASCGNFGGCVYRKICSQPSWLRNSYIQDSYVYNKHPTLEEPDES